MESPGIALDQIREVGGELRAEAFERIGTRTPGEVMGKESARRVAQGLALQRFAGVEPGSRVYFVHSYHVVPDEPGIVAATSRHGIEFAAAIERDNLMAVQFHPEKSSAVGMQILDNFGKL